MAHELLGLATVFAIALVTISILVPVAFIGRPRAPKVSILMLAYPQLSPIWQ
ncbi:MAG: hypothetical protein ACE5IB_07050 [Candidatus Geothermarchaeales archaeon]